ncbi:MAG: metallophosphoesterase [Verrucomicrobiae bacterium]|nr:metallophosphoesterase [Verrucomicrobiae bacterium]
MNESNFSFVVMGDSHYANAKYHSRQIKNGVVDDLRRYTWMKSHVTAPLLAEINRLKPSFVLQLGDFAEGGCDNKKYESLEMSESLQFHSVLNAPLFIAKGNHERNPAYQKTVWPFLSKNLGFRLRSNYFSFDNHESAFLLVDSNDLKKGNRQFQWLKKTLAAARNRKHIFICAHSPLFPIARPFFGERNFIEAMLSLLKSHPITAFFCGHTHNQCISIHPVGEQKLLQIKTAPTGFPPLNSIPLAGTRNILDYREAGKYEYCWGYLEDSAPSYFHVEVNNGAARFTHHIFRSGPIGIIESKNGRLRAMKRPKENKAPAIRAGGLKKITSAFLHMGLYDSWKDNKMAMLNGEIIGRIPKAGAFIPRKGIEVPKTQLNLIKPENFIEILNPEKENFTVGAIALEITLRNGKKARTNLSSKIYASTRRWNDWNLKSLCYVRPGKKTGPISLKFGVTR